MKEECINTNIENGIQEFLYFADRDLNIFILILTNLMQ